MGPVIAKPLQDVRMNHSEQIREERPGRFLKSGLKFRKDETIFAAYNKAEMRKVNILVFASSEFVHASKSLFWSDIIMLAGTDIDWMHSKSMTIEVQ